MSKSKISIFSVDKGLTVHILETAAEERVAGLSESMEFFLPTALDAIRKARGGFATLNSAQAHCIKHLISVAEYMHIGDLIGDGVEETMSVNDFEKFEATLKTRVDIIIQRLGHQLEKLTQKREIQRKAEYRGRHLDQRQSPVEGLSCEIILRLHHQGVWG